MQASCTLVILPRRLGSAAHGVPLRADGAREEQASEREGRRWGGVLLQPRTEGPVGFAQGRTGHADIPAERCPEGPPLARIAEEVVRAWWRACVCSAPYRRLSDSLSYSVCSGDQCERLDFPASRAFEDQPGGTGWSPAHLSPQSIFHVVFPRGGLWAALHMYIGSLSYIFKLDTDSSERHQVDKQLHAPFVASWASAHAPQAACN
mmetsp:Transcript_39769/g.127424  ORF Transcript_39769/g.127424 Transcript_39769/m.127424 type:complete len:206 (+) Transcript_39769:36-653(+)